MEHLLPLTVKELNILKIMIAESPTFQEHPGDSEAINLETKINKTFNYAKFQEKS